MRLFADDECKKEMTANFHKEAFEEAIDKKKNDFLKKGMSSKIGEF
jgi:hypothetical protein